MFSDLTLPFDLLIAAALACGISICIAAWIWRKRNRRRSRTIRFFVGLTGWVAAAFVLTTVYGAFIEPQIITVTRLDVPFPVDHPVTIAVVSDFHVGPYKGTRFMERLVQRINALMPDIVVLDGDFVLSSNVTPDVLQDLSPFKNLRPALATFAVLGNQDHGIFRSLLPQSSPPPDKSNLIAEKLQSLGITLLGNAHAVVNAGGDTMTIVGIDDPWAGTADIVKAFDGVDPGTPTVLLAHNPDVVLDPLSTRPQLIISGHTHGGQIRLPWIGALAALPIHIPQRFDEGLFTLQSGSRLAITRGVGESGPRIRLFAPPEVMLLTLGTKE